MLSTVLFRNYQNRIFWWSEHILFDIAKLWDRMALEFLVYDLLCVRNRVVFSPESAEWVQNLVVDSFNKQNFFKWVKHGSWCRCYLSGSFKSNSLFVLLIKVVNEIRLDAKGVLDCILVFCIATFETDCEPGVSVESFWAEITELGSRFLWIVLELNTLRMIGFKPFVWSGLWVYWNIITS